MMGHHGSLAVNWVSGTVLFSCTKARKFWGGCCAGLPGHFSER
jgi:hypothetical protein